MLQLALVYVNQAEREREIVADLRRRQILKAPDDATSILQPSALSTSTPRRTPVRTGAAGR